MSERFEIIPFHEHQILTAKTDNAILVVMKPIVDAFGLHWHAQRQRIHRHPVLSKGARIIHAPSAGGLQEVMALELEQFHGWLITIMPDRIKDQAKRDLIIRYQAEAFRVVFEHFHGRFGGSAESVRSVAGRIASQNQIMKLMRKLQATYHPRERRALHQMLDGLCQHVGIDTPALEDLGRDAPMLPDLLDNFWRAIDILEARGHELNFSRKGRLIALHLPTLRELLVSERMDVRVDGDMQQALEKSEQPRFVARKPVNCRDGKNRHCWVFERQG